MHEMVGPFNGLQNGWKILSRLNLGNYQSLIAILKVVKQRSCIIAFKPATCRELPRWLNPQEYVSKSSHVKLQSIRPGMFLHFFENHIFAFPFGHPTNLEVEQRYLRRANKEKMSPAPGLQDVYP